jgi:hypothetical protein
MSVPQTQSVIAFPKLVGIGVLLLGLAGVVGALAMLALASSFRSPLVEAATPAKQGFQMIQLGEFRRDQFLVNRDSGRVWQSVCAGKASGADCDGMLIWQEMYVDGVTPDISSAAFNYRVQAAAKE